MPHTAETTKRKGSNEPERGTSYFRRDSIQASVLPQQLVGVLTSLTDEGRDRFLAEIQQALDESSQKKSIRPFHDALESWYLTLMFVSEPDFETKLQKTAHEKDEVGLTLDELRDRFRLP